MKVLLVIPGPEGGGSMIFARRQAASLKKRGVEVQKFFLASRTHPGLLAREARRFTAVRRSFKPQLIHAHYGTMTAFFCAMLCPGPLVVTLRGSDLNPNPSVAPWRGRAGRLLTRLACMRARAVICVSQQLALDLGVARGRVVVLPDGVDLARFRPLERQQARRRLGWDLQQKVVLVSVGRNPGGKGLGLARQTLDMMPQARLELLRGQVPPDQMPLWLSAADCLLITSRFEGSPDIVKEALACALPVVSVPVGDVSLRINGIPGCAVTRRDPAVLSQALARSLTAGRSAQGRRRIALLSEPAVGRRLLAVYRQALEG